jgi:aminoglycoside 3-N-acetyltransferase
MVMTIDQFRETLVQLLGDDARPVVAYSGLFSIAREFPIAADRLPRALLDALLSAVGPRRTFLMPTYVSGFKNGVLNLDTEPAATGMINECFRTMAGVRRTSSVFWPFSVTGPHAVELVSLRPIDAVGEGSLFEWIETQNAHILMLGVHWHMCSFLHRLEWLAQVPYRYLKTFEGDVIRDGNRSRLRERVFVRSLDPLVENEWPGIESRLAAKGMRSIPVGRGRVAEIGAQPLLAALRPIIEDDPFAFVKNANVLRGAFAGNNRERP